MILCLAILTWFQRQLHHFCLCAAAPFLPALSVPWHGKLQQPFRAPSCFPSPGFEVPPSSKCRHGGKPGNRGNSAPTGTELFRPPVYWNPDGTWFEEATGNDKQGAPWAGDNLSPLSLERRQGGYRLISIGNVCSIGDVDTLAHLNWNKLQLILSSLSN